MELPINVIPSEVKPKDKRLEKMKFKDTIPKHPANVMILGRAGSGKSCCLYSMLKEGYVTDKGKSIFDEMLIYLGTGDGVEAFKKLPCENIAVMTHFDNETFETYLEDLKEHQLERLEKGKPAMNIAIVFDDMAAQSLLKPAKRGQASPLEHLLITSRHECNASIFYCSQIYKNSGFSTPVARNNMNYWIVYNMSKAEAEKIAEEHCGPMTKDEFMEWYNGAMRMKHNFVMINYKVPDEKRYTERFTKVYTPKSLIHLVEDAHSSSESEPEIGPRPGPSK
jgi:hypothetical protein